MATEHTFMVKSIRKCSQTTQRDIPHTVCAVSCACYVPTIRGNGINVVEANVLCMCKQAKCLMHAESGIKCKHS